MLLILYCNLLFLTPFKTFLLITQPNVLICLLDYADEAPLANINIEPEKWSEKPLILWRSGT